MGGSKVNTYSASNVNLSNMMTVLDHQRKGHFQLSLTEFFTDTRPQIAEGSLIEVAGALFKFDADEDIVGAPADGESAVVIEPDETTCRAVMVSTTTSPPVWDNNKHGYYLSGTNKRVVAVMRKSGDSYSGKWYLDKQLKTRFLMPYVWVSDVFSLPNGSEQTLVDTSFGMDVMALMSLHVDGYSDFYISSFSISGDRVIIKINQRTTFSPSVVMIANLTAAVE